MLWLKMSNENVLFAGLGRIRDQLVLATIFNRMTSQEKNEIDTSFQSFLTDAISRFSPGSREKRPFTGGIMYLVADRELSCVYALAVRGKSYPERLAFAFLGEFVAVVANSDDGRNLASISRPGGLTKNLRKPLLDLMDKYDKPAGIDKTSQVQGKVDHVKGIMQDNINKVIATHANLQDLEAKTDTLNLNAQSYQEAATDLRRKMWWQKMKVTILLVIVGVAILTYIIIMIVNAVK